MIAPVLGSSCLKAQFAAAHHNPCQGEGGLQDGGISFYFIFDFFFCMGFRLKVDAAR